jgi:hypothetical protein
MTFDTSRTVGIKGVVMALSILSATSTACHAAGVDSSVSVSGSLRGNYFSSSRTLDDRRDLLGTTLQIKGAARPSDRAAIKLEARATEPAVGRSSPGGEASLIEGYAAFATDRWDWRLGKQIVAWGRADGINPTDAVTPRDTTVLLPFDADQRTGVWGVMGSYALSSEASLSILWKGNFEPTVIPIPRAQRSHFRYKQPERPRPQWGLRLNRAGGDVDWSVSLYRGHSLLPHAGPDQPISGSPVTLTYPVITMAGADLATNFGQFGTRFEAAYTVPDDTPAASEPGLRRNLYIVAGIDRTIFPRLNFNLQAFVRHAWGLPGTLEQRYQFAQGFNAGTFMQQRPWVHGLTLRISNAWLQETLEAEIYIQRFLRDNGTFVQPMVTYAFNDALRGTLGGQYYAGSDAQFGPMRDNRGVFAEVRYSF